MDMSLIRHATLSLIMLFVCLGASYAQEKTQSYYNSHETEILPDAKLAFQNGKYERAEELCRWHYIIVGDNAADALRDMANRCAQLSADLTDFRIAGKTKEAKETAKTLLSINPNDVVAKEYLEEQETAHVDSANEEKPMDKDTVVTATKDIVETANEEATLDSIFATSIEKTEESVSSIPDASNPLHDSFTPRTTFVLKAGWSVLVPTNISQSTALGGSLGFYNLGGSRLGLEAGGYICPDLLSSVSLFGIDASLVLRISKSVYPRIGMGYFSYTDKKNNGATTLGLCAGGGLSFLLGGHLCLEVGTRYFPEITVHRFKTMPTSAGITYEFPSTKQLMSGGFNPFVSFGWAF